MSPVAEVASLFLKLGLLGFGGPAAHVALMEDEVVRRRGWMTREDFLDLVGAANLIPGPNSTELAIHIGRQRAGLPGLLVAGACFIVPAVLATLGLAVLYVRYGSLPRGEGLLWGVKPVMLAIVLQALWSFSRSALKSWPARLLAVGAFAGSLLGVHELLLLLLGGLLFVRPRAAVAALPLVVTPASAAATAAAAFTTTKLFLFFLKVGSVLFGSGYVLLAFLRADLVTRWGWLTDTQLVDAISAGQITPGPVFSTATFVGYLLGGVPGALVATLGIFLPSFVLVAATAPLIARLRSSPLLRAFLDGVNAVSVALMATVAIPLLRASVVDVISALIAVVALLLLARRRTSSALLIVAGGLLGLLRV